MKSKVEEYGDEVFEKLSQGAHIYFCGLKGMMPGILNMLEKVAKKKKLNWENTLKNLKKDGESITYDVRRFLFWLGCGFWNKCFSHSAFFVRVLN